jgi:aspartyl/asparaginyl beta-hydroxylase (cupin superfamily)
MVKKNIKIFFITLNVVALIICWVYIQRFRKMLRTNPYNSVRYINYFFGDSRTYVIDEFSWLQDFIEGRETIKNEFLLQTLVRNVGDISPQEKQLDPNNQWKMIPIQIVKKSIANNCPYTSSLVSKHRDKLCSVYFSILQPHTHLPPHRGPNNSVLRFHLPLIIPNGELGLEWNQNVERWDKPFIFDDTQLHQAWNYTDETRVILLIEILKPMNYIKRNICNWMLGEISEADEIDQIKNIRHTTLTLLTSPTAPTTSTV